jgi:hypothetical protein
MDDHFCLIACLHLYHFQSAFFSTSHWFCIFMTFVIVPSFRMTRDDLLMSFLNPWAFMAGIPYSASFGLLFLRF